MPTFLMSLVGYIFITDLREGETSKLTGRMVRRSKNRRGPAPGETVGFFEGERGPYPGSREAGRRRIEKSLVRSS
jgi:hypothetical protein